MGKACHQHAVHLLCSNEMHKCRTLPQPEIMRRTHVAVRPKPGRGAALAAPSGQLLAPCTRACLTPNYHAGCSQPRMSQSRAAAASTCPIGCPPAPPHLAQQLLHLLLLGQLHGRLAIHVLRQRWVDGCARGGVR